VSRVLVTVSLIGLVALLLNVMNDRYHARVIVDAALDPVTNVQEYAAWDAVDFGDVKAIREKVNQL
jgi:hypothetical protein